MKKTMQFICLVIIAILITVLVMSNNANAAEPSASVDATTVEVGKTITLKIDFHKSIMATDGKIIVSDVNSGVKLDSVDISSGTNSVVYSKDGNGFQYTGTDTSNNISEIIFKITGNKAANAKVDVIINTLQYVNSETGDNTGTFTYFENISFTEPDVPLTITPSNFTLKVGETKDLQASVEGVTWSSNKKEIATVNNGKVTAIAEGTAEITATKDNKTAKATVTVTKADNPGPVVEKITLNKTNVDLKINTVETLTSDVDVDWSSDDETVAVIVNGTNRECNITGLKTGKTTITATSKANNSVKATATINVVNPGEIIKDDGNAPVIVPNVQNITLVQGEKMLLSANKEVAWLSDNPSKVEVSANGMLNAVSEGSANIIATAKNGKTAAITVTVVNRDSQQGQEIAKLELTPNQPISLNVGDKYQVKANENVTWSTGNEAIAKIDSEGNITAVGVGTTVIIAIGNNNSIAQLQVTVTGNGTGNTNSGTNNSNKNNSNSSKNTSTGKVEQNNANSSSTTNEVVPATGETSTGTLVVLGIVTLIIATIIFRKKAK